MRTTSNILDDVKNNRNLKEAILHRSSEGIKNLKQKAKRKVQKGGAQVKSTSYDITSGQNSNQTKRRKLNDEGKKSTKKKIIKQNKKNIKKKNRKKNNQSEISDIFQ